jgi:hypothetical protein
MATKNTRKHIYKTHRAGYQGILIRQRTRQRQNQTNYRRNRTRRRQNQQNLVTTNPVTRQTRRNRRNRTITAGQTTDPSPTQALIGNANIRNLVKQYFTDPEQLPVGIPRNISDWDVSAVTIMTDLFVNIRDIPSLNKWNVSNVRFMDFMFHNSNYNQPLDKWDVSNVKTMAGMFMENFEFNQPINDWKVHNVTDMSAMFAGGAYQRTKFNQHIYGWNVGKVTTMRMMFFLSSFNKPLLLWNLANVEDMRSMFCLSMFNQSLHEWNINNVDDFEDMFRSSAMSQDLSWWGPRINPNANITDMFANSYVPEWYERLIQDRMTNESESNQTSPSESESESESSNATDDDDDADDEELGWGDAISADFVPLETNIAQIAPVPIPSTRFSIPSTAVAYDILEMEEVNVLEYLQTDHDNLVFVSGKLTNPVYYLSTRSQIARQRHEPTFIRFACRAVDTTAIMPRAENVDKTVAYLSLRSLHIGDGLVAMGEINYLLQTPEYQAVRVSPEPVRVLPATASQNMLESTTDQYRAVSAMHCQEGSNAMVYSLSAIQPV